MLSPTERRAVMLRGAPSIIGLAPKSQFDDLSRARAIREARLSARGCPMPLPVVHAGRVVAVVQGEGHLSERVRHVELQQTYRFAYTDYDDLLAQMAAGKAYNGQFCKTPTAAGIANNWYDLWPVTGNPTAGSLAGAAATAVQVSGSTAGVIQVSGNVTPDAKYITTGWGNATANTPTLMFVDRVLMYDSCAHTNTANQAMTNGVAAQRYIATGEPGLQIA